MKLEYFPDGSKECPLILIYGINSAQIDRLWKSFMELFAGKKQRIAIHDVPGFESIDGCQLFVAVGRKDLGVRQTSERIFEWILRPEVWEDVALLTGPFINPSDADGTRFQYLNPTSGISVILSKTRSW